MIALLREAGNDDGIVDATELADLRKMVGSAAALALADAVRVLAGKVVNTDPANAKFGSQTLGNLVASDSQAKLDKLIDKWFMGLDRPATTYTYRAANGSLFVNGAAITDIRQGYVGDCYLLAALGSVADIDGSLIQDMFTDNGDGTYTVRFFRNGVKDYVTVDSFLPTDSAGRLVYASAGSSAASSSNELWVALAEKAYAQLNAAGWIGQDGTNSYKGIEGGWMEPVYEQILGNNAESFYKYSQATLVNALNAGKMVTIGTNGSTTSGFVAGHAYIIKSYNASTGTFDLYNPWGTQHLSNVTFATLAANSAWASTAVKPA
jgi:hypothetical protein